MDENCAVDKVYFRDEDLDPKYNSRGCERHHKKM